jgi:transposase
LDRKDDAAVARGNRPALMARPTKLTAEREQRLLQAIQAGATRKAAALHAGIDERTLERCEQRFVGFADALSRAEADVEVRYAALIQQAAATDWRAAAWWLERRRAEDYARRDKVDLDVYVRQRARELGLDEDEALTAIRQGLRVVS